MCINHAFKIHIVLNAIIFEFKCVHMGVWLYIVINTGEHTTEKLSISCKTDIYFENK